MPMQRVGLDSEMGKAGLAESESKSKSKSAKSLSISGAPANMARNDLPAAAQPPPVQRNDSETVAGRPPGRVAMDGSGLTE